MELINPRQQTASKVCLVAIAVNTITKIPSGIKLRKFPIKEKFCGTYLTNIQYFHLSVEYKQQMVALVVDETHVSKPG